MNTEQLHKDASTNVKNCKVYADNPITGDYVLYAKQPHELGLFGYGKLRNSMEEKEK